MDHCLEMDAAYQCSLGEDDVKRAGKELHEDPRNRLGAVRQVREWIEEQPHITFPTDTHTLLKYLRYAKFSQLKAREVIEKNCLLRTHEVRMFTAFDTNDEMYIKFMKTGFAWRTFLSYLNLCVHVLLFWTLIVNASINNGSFLKLPGRGDKGQVRIIIRAGAYDPKEWKGYAWLYIKCTFMLVNYVLMNEETQVCGMEWLVDCTGLTVAHQMFISISEMKTFFEHLSHSLPIRIKNIHHYNESPIVDALIALFRPFVSKKIYERFLFHGSNLSKVYKHFPMECLPQEYLPDDYKGPHAGTIAYMTQELIEDLQKPEVHDYLAQMTAPEWGINLRKKPKDEGPAATFRRLSVS